MLLLECREKQQQHNGEKKMFKVEIEGQDKKVEISFRTETLEEAKALAEDQITIAMNPRTGFLADDHTVTAFVWNLTLGGIDATFERSMNENGWLN